MYWGMELVGFKVDVMVFWDGIYILVDGYLSYNDFDDVYFWLFRDDMFDVVDVEGVGVKFFFEFILWFFCCFCFGSYLN